jgi:hypothetical protein
MSVILGWETALQALTPSTDGVQNVIKNYLMLEISSGSELKQIR